MLGLALSASFPGSSRRERTLGTSLSADKLVLVLFSFDFQPGKLIFTFFPNVATYIFFCIPLAEVSTVVSFFLKNIRKNHDNSNGNDKQKPLPAGPVSIAVFTLGRWPTFWDEQPRWTSRRTGHEFCCKSRETTSTSKIVSAPFFAKRTCHLNGLT